MPGVHVSRFIDLKTGANTRINLFHVPWRCIYFNGGASDTLPFLWAKIRKDRTIWITPTTPLHLSRENIKTFLKLPWKIPSAVLKQTVGSDPKYTWLLINTRDVLTIGRSNIHEPTTRICLMILNKTNKTWSVQWVNSGSSFRWQSFGPWMVICIHLPNYNDAVGAATGEV